MDEEFPSLMGSSSTNERDNRPHNRIDYTSLKQKGANKSEAKPKSTEEQFPSLWSANSSMSNFREAPTTPVYRNISGYQPAWSSSNNSTNETVPTSTKPSQQASSSSSGMITLTKKSGKNPAPMPSGIDDFPSLEIPANVITNDNKKPQNNGEAGKKKKNKSKKGGLIGEDLISARPSKLDNCIYCKPPGIKLDYQNLDILLIFYFIWYRCFKNKNFQRSIKFNICS